MAGGSRATWRASPAGRSGRRTREGDPARDALDLYIKLERVILPLFYGLPFAYAEVMRSAIALNASFFNTQRMVRQYVHNSYFPDNLPTDVRIEETALLSHRTMRCSPRSRNVRREVCDGGQHRC